MSDVRDRKGIEVGGKGLRSEVRGKGLRSGTAMTGDDLERVVTTIKKCYLKKR